ncbi:unnamed protein product, partial [Musa acuminata subsp. burmannicoides]
MSKSDDDAGVEIRDVWADNLEAEFAVIREVVDDFPFVAMDTEFPGVAIRPLGDFKTVADSNYHILRANVDLLHLIQLGLTFSDAEGNLPASATGGRPIVWQFNFREFDVDRDISNPDSIDLLRKSDIDFKRNREHGVDANRFAELLMASGVVLNDSVRWVTFHCAYDFGYLLKILTCRRLPETREGFSELIRTFFPVMYDIKHLMRFSNSLHGGLNKVAEQLEVDRVGTCHQAGSDSLLTARAFRKLMEKHFDGSIDRYAGQMTVVDTGDDLIRVQCKPCSLLLQPTGRLFNTAASPSYHSITCNSTTGYSLLQAATGKAGVCGADRSTCNYALSCRDGSYTRGVLGRERIDIGGTSIEGFIFGCGLRNLRSHGDRQDSALSGLPNHLSVRRILLLLPPHKNPQLIKILLSTRTPRRSRTLEWYHISASAILLPQPHRREHRRCATRCRR